MDEKVILYLQKPPEERSPSETYEIMQAVAKYEFFRTLQDEQGEIVLQTCCNSLQLMQFKPNEYVFKSGDKGDSFYVITSGKVSVQVPKQIINDDGDKVEIMNEVVVLKMGDAFGEVALLRGGKRTATVQCTEAATMVVLHKKDYDNLLKHYQNNQRSNKVNFLAKITPFRTWTKSKLSNLSLFFSVKTYRRNQFVFKEGDECSAIYIIRYGEFKFTKKYTVRIENELTQSGFLSAQANPKSYKRIKESHRFLKKKQLEIGIKQKKEVFGFEEVIQESHIRSSTCECISGTGELWTISIEEFHKRINHPDSLAFFTSRQKLLSEWTEHRIDELKNIENMKVKSQFSVKKELLPPIKTTSTPRKAFKVLPLLKPSLKLPVMSVSITPQAKRTKDFKIFQTEIDHEEPEQHKGPSIMYTRSLIATLKPIKLGLRPRLKRLY